MNISIDASEVLGAFNRAPQIFIREIRIAVKEWLTSVQVEARKYHRYTTRSGNLDRSIQVEITPQADGSNVYLELGIAKYGPYIHEGFKSWKADKFLTQTAERKRPELITAISHAIGIAIAKVGF